MKKINMVLVATILFSGYSFAQKGSNFIGVGGDISMPNGEFGEDFNTAFGLYGKGMLGVGKTGQVTFTTGYSLFKGKGDFDGFTMNVSIIPLLFGYRFNMNGFFIEPQGGYGIYGFKYIEPDGNTLVSDGAVTWGANMGYVFNKQVEITARYQSGGKKGQFVNMFGLRFGYNFPISSTK